MVKEKMRLSIRFCLKNNFITQITFQFYLIFTTSVVGKHRIFNIILHLNIKFTKANNFSLFIHDLNLVKFELFFWHFYLKCPQLINRCLEEIFILLLNFESKLFLLNIPNNTISWTCFCFIEHKFILLNFIVSNYQIDPSSFIFKLFQFIKVKWVQNQLINQIFSW